MHIHKLNINININLILISMAVSLFLTGIFYYFHQSNNNKIITYIDIGMIAGSPALKPQLEIKKIEDLTTNNNIAKVKPKYIKDLNVLEIHFEYRGENFEAVKELSKNIEQDILMRATNEANKNIRKQEELNIEFRKLFNSGKLFVTGDTFSKNFDIKYITLPQVYYSNEKNYINITLLLGLFTILSITLYIVFLIINDNKIKK